MRHVPLVLVATLAWAFASASRAQDISFTNSGLPAVSGLNGKFSLESGVEGTPGGSNALSIASGSITMPLGHAFGLQVDGNGVTSDGLFGGGSTAHLFWRDPAIGLLGPYATIEGGADGHVGWYGAEGELYAGLVTLGANAGYLDTAALTAAGAQSGGFYTGHLTGYPVPDLALTAGLRSIVGHVAATGGVEFQPTFGQQHNISLFVDAEAGAQSSYTVLAGLRIYFGSDKTLIRRHREDDPAANPDWGFTFEQMMQGLDHSNGNGWWD